MGKTLTEPTFDRLLEELGYWREWHQKVIAKVDERVEREEDDNAAQSLMALRYELTACRPPSPIERDRVREFLDRKRDD